MRLLSLFLLLAPTYLMAEPVQNPDPSLVKRVETYWQARAVRDLHTMYKMESAARPGGWMTPDQMRAGWPVRNVRVLELKQDGDSAIAKVSVEMQKVLLPWKPKTLDDPWVLIEGTWYHKTHDPRAKKQTPPKKENKAEKDGTPAQAEEASGG